MENGNYLPMYKKGSNLECKNYRGISLLNVVYKIFTNILAQHIKIYTEEILGEYQCGFRQGRNTTDHIFTI
jgi:sorting nexin-29